VSSTIDVRMSAAGVLPAQDATDSRKYSFQVNDFTDLQRTSARCCSQREDSSLYGAQIVRRTREWLSPIYLRVAGQINGWSHHIMPAAAWHVGTGTAGG
jgi:hypothetical protein